MKLFLILFLNLITNYSSLYECDPIFFEINPTNNIISKNGFIIIESNTKGDLFQSLNLDEKLFLIKVNRQAINNNAYHHDTIKLEIAKRSKIGNYNQLIIKTNKVLEANKLHCLFIKDEYDPFQMSKNSSIYSDKRYCWITSIDSDTIAPLLKKQVKQIQKYSNYFLGGGVSYIVKFQCYYEEANLFGAHVQLKNDNDIKELFVPIKDSILTIGGNSCLNKFRLTHNIKYKARFKLLDNSLNYSNKWTTWQEFEFDNPFPKIIEE